MAEQSEHKVSEESIRLAQEHTKELAQHGESVENLGKAAQANAGKSMAEHGRAIQEQLKSGQAHLQELQQTSLAEAFGKVVEDHIQVSQAHAQATRAYLDLSRQRAMEMSQHKTSHGSARNLYEQLMALSQQALSSELYETAFHALTAAFHAAEALEDEQPLLAVERTAKAQQARIDAHTPKHRMSTHSAVQRGGTSLYGSLARQAATRVLLVKQKHRQAEAKPLPWPGDARREGH